MKRTTSMVAFLPTNHHHPSAGDRKPTPWAEEGERTTMAQKPRRHGGSSGRKGSHGYVSGPVSPDILPVTTASFLGACGLCRRPLGPGKDTFIYRGEIAFCSLECRQQQMSMDERTEKCSIASMKDNHSQATARSKNSCETAAS